LYRKVSTRLMKKRPNSSACLDNAVMTYL